MPKTFKILRSSVFNEDIRANYYCTKCSETSLSIKCFQCKSNTSQFCTLNLEKQLEKIILRHYSDMVSYLATAISLSKQNDVFGDCIQAEAYRCNLPNPARNGDFYINLCLSTDGVPIMRKVIWKCVSYQLIKLFIFYIFKPGHSLWPLHAIILELPPKVRCSIGNSLLLALWYGQKPNWNEFLRESISNLDMVNLMLF